MDELMIKIDNITKEYKLGQIGGTTLRDELQRLKAKILKREDPTKRIGAKNYNKGEKFLALDGVSFEVKKGERIGIIGHNGAGKSTLLKLLSRVTAPTGGTIYLNGRIASMLEVGTGFHPELTGRENIYMNGAILGMTKKEIDAKMEDIIEFSEVRQFIDTPVKRYSSGMYVKLAFSVAAHLDSEIMIMDEVLAVGDMHFQQKCLKKMSDVSKESGRTILYVSHNMNTIRQLCNRCIVLNKGKLIFDGAVEEGIEKYLNAFQYENEVEIDLSQKRMEHLSRDVLVKLEHITLINKNIPVYNFNEDICFDLTIKSNKDITNVGVRLEIRDFGDIPIGISANQNLGFLRQQQKRIFSFKLANTKIVPGKYKVLIVLYEIDKVGNYFDLDAVYPAFVYRIMDDNDNIKIKWDKQNWGSVYFGELKFDAIREINDQ